MDNMTKLQCKLILNVYADGTCGTVEHIFHIEIHSHVKEDEIKNAFNPFG